MPELAKPAVKNRMVPLVTALPQNNNVNNNHYHFHYRYGYINAHITWQVPIPGSYANLATRRIIFPVNPSQPFFNSDLYGYCPAKLRSFMSQKPPFHAAFRRTFVKKFIKFKILRICKIALPSIPTPSFITTLEYKTVTLQALAYDRASVPLLKNRICFG